MDINISLIKTGERYRKDMGDLQALADSIKELGQLQPIGVDSNYHLIFGQRRIKACELLGLDKVKGTIIPLKDIVKGEYAENEVRKDFTISECVEIGKAIEQELGERRGKPGKDIPPKLEELQNKETAQIAAEKSGLGSKNTYRQAKKTINNGSPELIKKLDNKEISISAAAKVAKFDKEHQVLILKRVYEDDIPIQTSIERQKK